MTTAIRSDLTKEEYGQAINILTPQHIYSLLVASLDNENYDVIDQFIKHPRLIAPVTSTDFTGVAKAKEPEFHPCTWPMMAIVDAMEKRTVPVKEPTFYPPYTQSKWMIKDYDARLKDAAVEIFKHQYDHVKNRRDDPEVNRSVIYLGYSIAGILKDDRVLQYAGLNILDIGDKNDLKNVIGKLIKFNYTEPLNSLPDGYLDGLFSIKQFLKENIDDLNPNQLKELSRLLLTGDGQYAYNPKDKKSKQAFCDFHSYVSGTNKVYDQLPQFMEIAGNLFNVDPAHIGRSESDPLFKTVRDWGAHGVLGHCSPALQEYAMGTAPLVNGSFHLDSMIGQIFRGLLMCKSKSEVLDGPRTIEALTEHMDEPKQILEVQHGSRGVAYQCLSLNWPQLIGKLTDLGLQEETLHEIYKKEKSNVTNFKGGPDTLESCVDAHRTRVQQLRALEAKDFAQSAVDELKMLRTKQIM